MRGELYSASAAAPTGARTFAPKMQAATAAQGGAPRAVQTAHTVTPPPTREPRVQQPRRIMDPTLYTPDRVYAPAPTTRGRTPDYAPAPAPQTTSAPLMPLYDPEEDRRARAGLDPVAPPPDAGSAPRRGVGTAFGVAGGLAVGLGVMWWIRR